MKNTNAWELAYLLRNEESLTVLLAVGGWTQSEIVFFMLILDEQGKSDEYKPLSGKDKAASLNKTELSIDQINFFFKSSCH